MACEQLKLENQGCFRLYTVSRLIVQAYKPWFDRLGITYTQYIVLLVLWEKDLQPVNDIAKRLYLETNTITPLIQRMEQRKIISRRKDKNDARKVIVSLTERGKAIQEEAAEIPGCMTELLAQKGVQAEQMIQLFPVLDNIIKAMTTQNAGEKQ